MLYGVDEFGNGVIEGTKVHDNVLDTGCTRTMLRGDLLSSNWRARVQLSDVPLGYGVLSLGSGLLWSFRWQSS